MSEIAACPTRGHAWTEHGQDPSKPLASCQRDDCGCVVWRAGSATTVECVCGAPIKQVTLPPDIARASGQDAFWNHIGGDIYCYEDDRQAMAEPLEVSHAR